MGSGVGCARCGKLFPKSETYRNILHRNMKEMGVEKSQNLKILDSEYVIYCGNCDDRTENNGHLGLHIQAGHGVEMEIEICAV